MSGRCNLRRTGRVQVPVFSVVIRDAGMGKGLQSRAKRGLLGAHAFGHNGEFAGIAGIEHHDTGCIAEAAGVQNDSFRGPNHRQM